jgi:multiple sugar transport system permease protein
VEDNALVDSCSHVGVLWRIVLPLAAPGVAATAIFAFISSWTEFVLALYLTSTYAVTVPVTLAGWITRQAELIGEISALALLSVLPIFVISLFVQRHFVRGLTVGAVKT